jgi:uncharacterized protein (TIGR03067 family)
MRMLLALGLMAAAFGVAVADDKKDPTAGKWTLESVTFDGRTNKAASGVREHANGKYTLAPSAGAKANTIGGTYTIDATKSPIEIDFKPDDRDLFFKGETLRGIAKIEGNTLTIAYTVPEKNRPTKFESTKGSGVYLMVHKKAK